MLVLTRLPDEQVMIGDDIVVTVCRVDGLKVGLGFAAPASIQIHRAEVWDRIRAGKADDPTRQTITTTLNRQEAWLIAEHFRFLSQNGNEVAAGIVHRFDRLLAKGRP